MRKSWCRECCASSVLRPGASTLRMLACRPGGGSAVSRHHRIRQGALQAAASALQSLPAQREARVRQACAGAAGVRARGAGVPPARHQPGARLSQPAGAATCQGAAWLPAAMAFALQPAHCLLHVMFGAQVMCTYLQHGGVTLSVCWLRYAASTRSLQLTKRMAERGAIIHLAWYSN